MIAVRVETGLKSVGILKDRVQMVKVCAIWCLCIDYFMLLIVLLHNAHVCVLVPS